MSRQLHLVSAQQGWAPEAPPSVDTRHGIGARLRQAREARGLTFDVIASQTKIPPHHLEAIERGTSALPAFYQRAEIRAFARAVGVDERVALGQFETPAAPVEAPPPQRPQVVPVFSPRVQSHLQSAVALLLAALTGAVLARTAFPPAAESEPGRLAPAAASARAVRADRAQPAGIATSSAASVPTGSAPAIAPGASEAGTPIVEPPSADGSTELVVTSRPAGARVTVNGIGWGTTPVTIRHLPPGDKRIRVTKDGYAASERAMTVGEGRRRSLNVELTTLR